MFRSLINKRPFWQAASEGTTGQTDVEPGAEDAPSASLLSSGGAAVLETDASKAAPPLGETGATKAEGAEGAPAVAEQPVNFDIAALTLPEGVTLDETVGKAFTDLLNDSALTPQERGQKLFDLYSQNTSTTQSAAQEAQVKAWSDLNSTWRTEVDSLPEFKGKVDVELGAIKEILSGPEFRAPKEFFAALDLTGAGNNPHVLQILHKLTAPYREGKPVGGDPAVQSGSRLAGMYPTMKSKE